MADIIFISLMVYFWTGVIYSLVSGPTYLYLKAYDDGTLDDPIYGPLSRYWIEIMKTIFGWPVMGWIKLNKLESI